MRREWIKVTTRQEVLVRTRARRGHLGDQWLFFETQPTSGDTKPDTQPMSTPPSTNLEGELLITPSIFYIVADFTSCLSTTRTQPPKRAFFRKSISFPDTLALPGDYLQKIWEDLDRHWRPFVQIHHAKINKTFGVK